MIISLNKERYSFACKNPLDRIGLLLNKNYAINRVFDVLSFSCIMRGGKGWLKSGAGEIELTPPFCMLSLPGEKKSFGPYKSWDEFYFVYSEENFESLFGGAAPNIPENGIISGTLVPEVEFYIRKMTELMQQPLTNESYIQFDSLALLILSLSFWRPEINKLTENEKRLQALITYINCNYRNNVKLPELVADFGLSYPNFRRLWRNKFKQSPHQMIMDLRNNEARELLLSTTLPIDDIARKTGFDEQRYFSRFFHKINGCTPTEFRNKAKNELS